MIRNNAEQFTGEGTVRVHCPYQIGTVLSFKSFTKEQPRTSLQHMGNHDENFGFISAQKNRQRQHPTAHIPQASAAYRRYHSPTSLSVALLTIASLHSATSRRRAGSGSGGGRGWRQVGRRRLPTCLGQFLSKPPPQLVTALQQLRLHLKHLILVRPGEDGAEDGDEKTKTKTVKERRRRRR